MFIRGALLCKYESVIFSALLFLPQLWAMKGEKEGREKLREMATEPKSQPNALLTPQIPPSHLQTFQSTYSSLLKASLAPSMRKRDKKREKAKAESAAKKRKEVYVDVVLGEEGKRGKGRRQRVSESRGVCICCADPGFAGYS